MGRYNFSIQHAQSLPNNLAAIDFTDWQETPQTYKNNGLATNAGDAFGIGNPQRTSEGVLLNGIDQHLKFRVSDNIINLRSAFLLYRPIVNGNGYLFELGSGDGTSAISLNFRAFQYDDGDVLGDAGGTATRSAAPRIVTGAINHFLLCEQGANGFMFTGEVPDGTFEIVGNSNPENGSDIWVSIGGTRASGFFSNIEVLFFAAWDYVVSTAEIDPILENFNHYGRLLLPTNLESTRHQSHLSLGANREVTSRGFTPIGETDLDIRLPYESGQTVEFFAFDTDTEQSILTTGPVIPDPFETLVFNPVSGGGGGDPGTGQLAHIAGTVSIDGTGKEREVIVISDDPAGRQVLGEGMSASDGTFDIQYPDWGGAVIALALDDYGGNWAPSTALASGTIIHPTVPNGHVYKVTTGGTTGTTEPTWSTTGAVNDGSVAFSPRPFYRPIASGPLQGEITQTEPAPETTYIEMRIQITANGDANNYNELAEFEFLDADGAVFDVSGAGVVFSHQHNSLPAANAFDGDIGTHWNSGQGVPTPWIGVQFVTAVAVKQIRLTPKTNYRAPTEFTIEYSIDTPGTWTAAATHTTTWPNATPQTFNVEAP